MAGVGAEGVCLRIKLISPAGWILMKPNLIITHPGSAHFDEVTAISLILAVNASGHYIVERREPTGSELDDPNVWVVDVGNRHEPSKHNFDHHQSTECPAAFVLVADYLGLKDTLSVMPWWDFKDSVDRIGPRRSSVQFNAGDDLVNRNPVEIWLTASFAASPENALPLLEDFGTRLIEDARLLRRQIDFWKSCPRVTIAGVPAVIGETHESAGLEEFRRLDDNPPDIVISLDRPDNGWRLFRYDGAPVDFSRISDRPEVAFAHANGFLAKTKARLGMDELVSLVSQAITQPSAGNRK